ncbi:hypothetical protein SteCoe_24772 [Stentor coeruleus]|uniref:Flavodoxin-like fold domain-containing protein n=1 Tax=Stentor coeruleus TaxID=5963 RepID=A0A1R2BGR1_9CILI|nr:hypothetical protein SteCoe_24772 [Stentor coeruleus]
MNALVVSSISPTDEEMNRLKGLCISSLASQNYSIIESDLERENFNPCISLSDYPGVSEQSISQSQKKAYPNNYSVDILQEIEKIKQSDLIIIIAKLKFGILPTRLVGWMQRVFVLKFAIFSEDKYLHGKKIAFLIKTDGRDQEETETRTNKFIEDSFKSVCMKAFVPFYIHQDINEDLTREYLGNEISWLII